MKKLTKDQIEIVSGGVVRCQCEGGAIALVYDENACMKRCCDVGSANSYTVYSATPQRYNRYPRIGGGSCQKTNDNDSVKVFATIDDLY